MRVQDCNWMQLERYLERDDRIVLPLGSTEQHAYLSLATDNILAERIAIEAAEPLGVPVLPVLAYGITPAFAAYPGSPSLREATYAAVLRELLGSLHGQGFRRFLLVNGHGGNAPAAASVEHWAAETHGARVIWHNWFNTPSVREAVDAIDHDGAHASWMENFPWTRLPGVELPTGHKPRLDFRRDADPARTRAELGDGMIGGWYQRPDEEVLEVWRAGVEEVRALLAAL
jgi:creatinine amidohydrolase